MLDTWVEKFYGKIPSNAVANQIKFVPEDLLTLSLSREPLVSSGNVVNLSARRGSV